MKMALHWKIIIGLALGIAVGIALNLLWDGGTWKSLGVGSPAAYLAGKADPANGEAGIVAGAARFIANLLDFIGKLFIRCLRFIAVPIVLFSLIAGAASLGDVRKLGRIGGKTVAIFAVTTLLATIIGITLTRVVNPAQYVSDETQARLVADRTAESRIAAGQAAAAERSGWGQVLNIVPLNPFEALAKGDMLQVVMLSLTLGCCLTLIPRARAGPVIAVCEAVVDAITRFIDLLMRAAPYAVFAIIVPIVATVGLDVLTALAVYSLVVVVGLAIVQFVVYPAMLVVMVPRSAGISPGKFFRGVAPAQLLAFSSSSSNATLPVNMECCRRNLGVSEEVTSFVLPLGATINMNGTALYLSVVAIFLSQLFKLPLTLGEQVALAATATLSAIGTAGIPGASIALMVIVLETVHVPPEGILIVLGVDRILDMCRTVVNITGDAATAVVVAAGEGELGPPAPVPAGN